jgi:CRISPR/Cas system endoribonuclease Cas6 (RAMP superfamily)
MLTAVVLQLRPVAEAGLPRSHGWHVFTAVRDLLGSRDPNLAHMLHENHDRKPLTCSRLGGVAKRDRENWLLSPDQLYTLRLTGLTPIVSQHLLQLWSEVRGLRIKDAVFSVGRVSLTRTTIATQGRSVMRTCGPAGPRSRTHRSRRPSIF